MDLKSIQSVRIEKGKLRVLDVYFRQNIPLGNGQRLEYRILQQKTVDNSQSCGTLAARFVEIALTQEREKGTFEVQSHIVIPGERFGELVTVGNYFAKFRDSWERIGQTKKKTFQYDLEEGSIILEGSRDILTLKIFTEGEENKRRRLMYGTDDLRIITSFSDNLNAVQKFYSNHRFDECL